MQCRPRCQTFRDSSSFPVGGCLNLASRKTKRTVHRRLTPFSNLSSCFRLDKSLLRPRLSSWRFTQTGRHPTAEPPLFNSDLDSVFFPCAALLSYLIFERIAMQRFSLLLAAFCATNVSGQVILAVAGAAGDATLTSNCGSTLQNANAVRAHL